MSIRFSNAHRTTYVLALALVGVASVGCGEVVTNSTGGGTSGASGSSGVSGASGAAASGMGGNAGTNLNAGGAAGISPGGGAGVSGSAGAAGVGGVGGVGGSGDNECATVAACLVENPDAMSDLAKPVQPPGTGETPGTDDNIQAIAVLHLGDPDIDADSPSYKDLGFDLDGVNSSPTWAFHCHAPKSAQKEVRQDGVRGIDNMFAKKIITTLAGLAGDTLAGTSDRIQQGYFSSVIKMTGIQPGGSNYQNLDAKYYPVQGKYGTDGIPIGVEDYSTYAWNPWDQFSNGVSLPHSYMNNHVWVSGDPTTLPFSMSFGGAWMNLTIHSGIIQTKLDATNNASTEGVIAGAVYTNEVLDQIPAIAELLGQCDLSSFQSALDSFRNFSDIYLDDNGQIVLDPTKDCNALSIGIGFSTTRSMLADAADPPTQPGNCP